VFTWALLDALRKGDSNGNGLIELSELVAHVQTAVPAISKQLDGTGRGMIAVDGTTEAGPEGYQQTARFGSRGEDFPLVGKLQ
jgi:hypothetical protein